MAAADKGRYDPTAGMRTEPATQAEKLEGGIGLGAEKNPTPTLRIFGSNLGNQWLCYGTIGGGTQDYEPSPKGSNAPAGCKWFLFYYTGIMDFQGVAVMGHWRIKVEGEGLESLAYEIGKHIKTTMMVGEKVTGLNPILVKSITIEPHTPKKLEGFDDEEEYEFKPTC